jgi:hypothetical protein
MTYDNALERTVDWLCMRQAAAWPAAELGR